MQQVVRRAACSNFTNADGIWVLEEGGNGVLPGYTTMPSYFAQQVDFVKTAIAPECPPPPAPTVYTQAPTGGSCWFNPSDLNCELCYPGYNQCSWQGCSLALCSLFVGFLFWGSPSSIDCLGRMIRSIRACRSVVKDESVAACQVTNTSALQAMEVVAQTLARVPELGLDCADHLMEQ